MYPSTRSHPNAAGRGDGYIAPYFPHTSIPLVDGT